MEAGDGQTGQVITQIVDADKSQIFFLTSIIDSSEDAVICKTPEGLITSWNPAAERIFGYPAEEVIGKPLSVLESPDKQGEMSELLEKVRNGVSVDRYQTHRNRKDGSVIHISLTISLIHSPEGELVGIASIARDLTERNRIVADYRRIFETTGDGILILDAQTGEILDVNPFLVWLLDYSRDDLLGKKLWDIGVWSDVADSKASFAELQQKEYLRYEDYPLVAKGGRKIFVEFISNVYQAGAAKLIQCNIRDITSRTKLEAQIKALNDDLTARVSELEEANQELDAFNRMASHDLRQPLNTIGTSCQALELLCGEKLDDECKKYVHIAYDRVLAMSGLIEALLKFSRMAHAEPRLEILNLSEMSSNVFLELKLGDPERRVSFKVPECLTAVGDPNLIYSVLQNLIGNAWKYTGKKEQAIIELGATESDGERVYFVRDNGIGFAPADAGKLFNPFERLPGSELFKGNGIGLATVDRIIRRHKGRIRAEGEAGKGATFYFTLPGQAVSRKTGV
jgi:PAS domain S-box-containing protein